MRGHYSNTQFVPEDSAAWRKFKMKPASEERENRCQGPWGQIWHLRFQRGSCRRYNYLLSPGFLSVCSALSLSPQLPVSGHGDGSRGLFRKQPPRSPGIKHLVLPDCGLWHAAAHFPPLLLYLRCGLLTRAPGETREA